MGKDHNGSSPSLGSEGASAMAVVQRRSCTLHHPPHLGVLGSKIPGEHLGTESFISLGLALSCLLPAQDTRTFEDRVRTSLNPQAEPAPWQVLSASTLDFIPHINPAGQKTIPEAKAAWKMLFIPLNSL